MTNPGFHKQKIYMTGLQATIMVHYHKAWGDPKTIAITEIGKYAEINLNISKPVSIPVIVHEVIHAVRYELGEKRGHKGLGEWEDETLPYCCDYVVGKIIDYLRAHSIRII